MDIIFRSLTPPLFSFNFQALLPIPSFHSFDILSPSSKKNHNVPPLPISEIRRKFKEFASRVLNGGIAIYTDGSKKDDDFPVGSAVFSTCAWPSSIGSPQIRLSFLRKLGQYCKP